MQKELEKLSTNVVNELCSLDMKYTFTDEEHDRMLKQIQNIDEFARNRFERIAQSANWILRRFKLPDGCKEELDEIVRMATIGIEPQKQCETAIQQVDRLGRCILKYHADEIGKGDLINGESAVDVAIRLLTPISKEAV